jgi:hypothetical protein
MAARTRRSPTSIPYLICFYNLCRKLEYIIHTVARIFISFYEKVPARGIF